MLLPNEFQIFPLEDPKVVMFQAQYQVCHDFVEKLQQGCPEVTAIIGKVGATEIE